MKLIDIPKNSKIICQCSDGSQYLIFDHIDGMYSFCRTENGGIAHLYCMIELSELPDGSYKIDDYDDDDIARAEAAEDSLNDYKDDDTSGFNIIMKRYFIWPKI